MCSLTPPPSQIGLPPLRIVVNICRIGSTHSEMAAYPAGFARHNTTVHPHSSAEDNFAQVVVVPANTAKIKARRATVFMRPVHVRSPNVNANNGESTQVHKQH